MSQTPHLFETPWGPLSLQTWPQIPGTTLQAWNGADRLLLKIFAEIPSLPGQILAINDDWGTLALSLELAGAKVTVSGDSFCSQQGLRANQKENGPQDGSQEDDGQNAKTPWLWPGEPPQEKPDLVVLKVPRDLAMLEDQLVWIRRICNAGAPVLVGCMDKHMPKRLKQVMERHLENIEPHRGRYKAHAFTGHVGKPLETESPRDDADPLFDGNEGLQVPELGLSLVSLPGVFGRKQVDPGGRFLANHLPEKMTGWAADLGCGNGLLGIAAMARNPELKCVFCDDSWRALQSTRHNIAKSLGPDRVAKLHHGNGFDGVDQPLDYVLLNPPFHRGSGLDTGVAHLLIRHALRTLGRGGELRLVVNRHLDYHSSLDRGFTEVRIVAGNQKFVVVSVLKIG